MFKRISSFLGVLAVLAASSPSSAATTLTVLGPPIGRAGFEDVIKNYQKAHPDVTVTIQYAASAITMATVKSGSLVDLAFVPDSLAAKEPSLLDVLTPAFQNHTEIVVSKKAAATIKTPKDLGNKGVRLGGGTVGSVVEGYQGRMLANLSKSFGADLPDKYKANVATTNAVSLKFLDQMDADQIDAAIIPSSEIPAGKYVVLPVPADAPAVNKYVGALVKASRNAAVARDFLAFACGPQSQASWKLSHFDVK